jgi:hypothetical protein
MEPWQQRVIDEKAELDGRIARLYAFVSGPACNDAPVNALACMYVQVMAMREYSFALGERIALFSKDQAGRQRGSVRALRLLESIDLMIAAGLQSEARAQLVEAIGRLAEGRR